MPLLVCERALWLWRRLRQGFPLAIAAILMPDHVHLVIARMLKARRRLAAILGSFARKFDLGELWLPIHEPEELTTPDKRDRAARYVHLNPCRPWRGVRLARDPLAWPWSTHRDAVGAIAAPWVGPERLASALDREAPDFAAAFHRYVSRDGHVAVSGTPFPTPASPGAMRSLDDIERAVSAATRLPRGAVRVRGPARTTFCALALQQGWPRPGPIAERCAIHPRTVARVAAHCPPSWLAAAALCLGDERLLVTGMPAQVVGSRASQIDTLDGERLLVPA